MRPRFTVVEPLRPPVIRTALFPIRVAVWPCTGAGIAVAVAAQVVAPFHNSAVPSDELPFEPPATNTWPLVTMLVGNSVAVWADRTDVIVPAEGHVAAVPDAGIVNTSVVPRVVAPLLPPVINTLPFASVVAVCPSRVTGRAVVVDQVNAVPSNSWALVKLVVPLELPPAISTLLLNEVLLLVSKVAEWALRADAMFVATAVHAPMPDAGLYVAAVCSTLQWRSSPRRSRSVHSTDA